MIRVYDTYAYTALGMTRVQRTIKLFGITVYEFNIEENA